MLMTVNEFAHFFLQRPHMDNDTPFLIQQAVLCKWKYRIKVLTFRQF